MSSAEVGAAAVEPPREFDVCLSYASENGDYVEDVVEVLKRLNINVFYDRNAEVELWGKDLPTELRSIFSDRARLCVVFVSAHYKDKEYTTIELQSAVARARRQTKEYLLPARFDDTVLPELSDRVKYISLRRKKAKQFAKEIARKVRPGEFPWWRLFPIRTALVLVALLLVLAVAAKAGLRLRPSRTDFQMIEAAENWIRIDVSNKRSKPSELVGFRLKFDGLPIEDAPLRIAGSDWAKRKIDANSETDLFLTIPELKTRPDKATGAPVLYRHIEKLVPGGSATLEIDVLESDDAPEKPSVRSKSFSAARIGSFIRKKTLDLSFMLKGSNRDRIEIHVNNGARPVELDGFRLKFAEKPPIEDADLYIVGTDYAMVPLAPNTETSLLLYTWELNTRCDPRTLFRPPWKSIENLIAGGQATIEIRLREPGDPPGRSRPNAETFPAERIETFIEERVAEHAYPCTETS